ncbi:hypothetical protein ACIPQ3_09365 [Streptomyces albidoflavus]
MTEHGYAEDEADREEELEEPIEGELTEPAPPPPPAGTSGEPDVHLDVPQLHVDEIDLQVEELRAKVSLQAEVLSLLKLNVGADVDLSGVELDIKGVDAQALLNVRLDNVAAIIGRVLATIDRNPQILEQITAGLGATAENLGEGAGRAVGELGEGAGEAVQETGKGARKAVEGVGEGAGKATEQVGEGAGKAAEEVGGSAGEAVEEAGDAASDVASEAGDTVSEAGDTASEAAGSARRTAEVGPSGRPARRGARHEGGSRAERVARKAKPAAARRHRREPP